MARFGSDAGHGGNDPGAIGKVLKLEEEDVTLDIVMKLNKEWELDGHTVITTRTADYNVSLPQRSAKLRNAKLDIILSIHINSSTNSKANYARAFVQTGHLNDKAGKIGQAVIKRVKEATGWTDAGTPVAEANLHMTRETDPSIAVVLELGFISFVEQERQLSDPEFRSKIAHAIVLGTYDYLGFKPSLQPVSNTIIYTVKPGDYLGKIAQTYKTTVEAIVKLNNINNPSMIRVGQKILIPGSTVSPTPTTPVQNDIPELGLAYRAIRMFNCDVHILEIDPNKLEIKPSLGVPGRLEKLSTIIAAEKAIAGINLGFFDPNGKAEHYGLLFMDDKLIIPPNTSQIECFLTKNNKMIVKDSNIADIPTDIKWGVGTSFSLVIDGKKDIRKTEKFPHWISDEPRTIICQRTDGIILLVVVDGRNKNSAGMTAYEMGDLMLALDAEVATNLDGGGSSEMAIRDEATGKVIILNKPSDGQERFIGSAMLVFKKAENEKQPTLAEWETKAINYAVGNGISDGSRPHDPVKRVEVMDMFRRFAEKYNLK